MISVIITAFKEPKTIGKAIEEIAKQRIPKSEILVLAPDKETLDSAKEAGKKISNVKIIKDSGEGKPSALNLAVEKARGDILILTDGDVYVGEGALVKLLEKFKDKKVGAVSGRPVSINSMNNKYGYWAEILTKTAHERRKEALKRKKRFFCSGYLFAIRKNLFPKLRKEILSEDGFISHYVYEKGYKIEYSEESRVFVKYPDNFKDWINQKKRSAGGYNQIKKISGAEMRSFKKESGGFFRVLKHAENLMQIIWTIELFIARVYLWALIYRDINLRRKSHKEIWVRIDSTK